MMEEVGAENIFIFGLRAEEIRMMRQRGLYSPRAIYESDAKVKRILDCFAHDRFSPQEPGLFRWIFDELINRGDRFFHVADLPAYMAINERIDQEFLNRPLWNRKAILNTARSPKFSSDRTIQEYAHEIWGLKSFPPDWVSFPLPQLYGDGGETIIPDSRAVSE